MPLPSALRKDSIVIVLLVAAVISASSIAAAQESKTWSSQADFQAGVLLNVDASSDPGRLVLASQPPGSTWTKSPLNPVFRPSASGWDSSWLTAPDILFENGTYKMWYHGVSGSSSDIGYATSADGLTWSRYASNPVLLANGSSWDTGLGAPRVLHDGNVYRMWYDADGPLAIRIGYATSPDGVTWTKHGTAPVFNGTMAWDAAAVAGPAVIKEGSTFTMYFSGHSGDYIYKIGRATSPDGVNWTEDPGNPLMLPQDSWEDTRMHPSQVLLAAPGYQMYYTGVTYASGSPVAQIGHATSTDGRTWTRDPSNPVLRIGPAGAWDQTSVAAPWVIPVGASERMYYGGYSATLIQIGYATYGSVGRAFDTAGAWFSPVFDSGNRNTTWDQISWTGTTPAETAIIAEVGVGNTTTPDVSWTFTPPSAPILISPSQLHLPKARYAVVGIGLATNNTAVTPTLDSVTLSYSFPAVPLVFFGIPLFLLLLLLIPVIVLVAIGALFLRNSRGARAAAAPPATTCSRCGMPISMPAKSCPRCGADLAPPPPGGPPSG